MVNYIWENIFKKERGSSEVIAILKNNILFKDLTHSEVRFLESMLHIRNYLPGEVVFSQGERGVGMYIVLKGVVEISVNNTESKLDNPERISITRLKKEDFFGELALIEDSSKRTATAVALEETQLIGFFQPDLLEIIERNPSTGTKVSIQLAKVLGKRLKETTNKVSELRRQISQLSTFES